MANTLRDAAEKSWDQFAAKYNDETYRILQEKARLTNECSDTSDTVRFTIQDRKSY